MRSDRLSWGSVWARFAILGVAFVFAYYNAIHALIMTWSGRDDYSHGFLVPFISLYFVWIERDNLRGIQVYSNIPGGLFLIFISGILLIAGTIGSVVFIQELSLLVIAPALVWFLFGTRYLKALTLPIAYLIFMVPVLDPFLTRIRWPFQLITAKCTGVILKLFGIPSFQYMQFIELPGITLEVADICSGVNYFVTIMAIAIPLAYFSQHGWKRRTGLLIFAFLIVIFANIIRVTLIATLAYNGWTGAIHGPLHIFQGFFVAVFGFIALFIGAWVLSRYAPSIPELPVNVVDGKKDFADIKMAVNASVVASAIMFFLAAFIYLYKPAPVPLRGELSNFPLTIGKWQGKDLSLGNDSLRLLEADSEASRIYRNESGREINLYIGYYNFQKQGKELVNYRFAKLYKNVMELTIPMDANGPAKVNKTAYTDGTTPAQVMYFYVINGRFIANNYQVKLLTFIDGLIHRKTNGAIIILTTSINKDVLMQDKIDFIRALLPELSAYIP